ncbi:hypothetical protein D3C77_380480 [compost metagenome]
MTAFLCTKISSLPFVAKKPNWLSLPVLLLRPPNHLTQASFQFFGEPNPSIICAVIVSPLNLFKPAVCRSAVAALGPFFPALGQRVFVARWLFPDLQRSALRRFFVVHLVMAKVLSVRKNLLVLH